MDSLVKALAPVFAAGFAIQQLLELLDPLLSRFVDVAWKKVILGLISLVIGLILSGFGGFRTLLPLFQASSGSTPWNHPVLDVIVTGLILSAGTEGLNSIMKFLGYAKETKKAEAATAQASTPAQATEKLKFRQEQPVA